MSEAFGRPVIGEVSYYSEGLREQHDPQLFVDALDELLAVPSIKAVRWTQYTPYFNDGDACVFSPGEPLIALVDDVAGEDGYDGDYGSYEEGEQVFRSSWDLYDYPNGYDRTAPDGGKVSIQIEGIDVDTVRVALDNFSRVLQNGHHYAVLNDKFGDPAEVTATSEGFHVEFYDHD